MADAYFFDIDGTLLVTSDLVHWNGLHKAMLEVYGIDTTIEGLLYHGKTDIAILRNALSIWACQFPCTIAFGTSCAELLSALD